MTIEFLHTMVRVSDITASLEFYCDGLGLTELRRVENEKGRFTLIFLAAPEDIARGRFDGKEKPMPAGLPMIELTYNWDEAGYEGGRNFGHLAYRVDNIYSVCDHLVSRGIIINRPPCDGRMAFTRSPDGISVELLQKGEPLPPKEPWATAENIGTW